MVPENWRHQKIVDILDRVSIPVIPEKNKAYREIGIRSHGKGIFHKDITDAYRIGNKRVFQIIQGALILNIVFAWEQAIAKTTFAEANFIASHRFPQFLPIKEACDVDYLVYFFLTSKGKHLLGLASPGGAGRNKTLGQKEFEKLNLLLPPVKEQRKIAKILQTWDRAIATTEKLIDASKQQKKALMQQLLTGKKRFAGFEGEWVVFSLAELCRKPISYGIVQTGETTSHGIPCVRVVDLTKRVLCTENMVTTSQEIHHSYKKTILEQGELMMALRGKIGLVRLVDKTLKGINITRGIARLSPNKGLVDSEYLLWAMRSESSRKGLLAKAGGSALQEIALASTNQQIEG